MRQAEIVVKLVVGVGFLDRIQIFALDVFDQCNLQGVAFLQEILNYRWQAWQARSLCGPEAALACDEPVPVVARPRDNHRLDDPMFEYAARQFVDGLLIECLARLIWIQRDAIERYLRQGG